jgi:hypothetical protein
MQIRRIFLEGVPLIVWFHVFVLYSKVEKIPVSQVYLISIFLLEFTDGVGKKAEPTWPSGFTEMGSSFACASCCPEVGFLPQFAWSPWKGILPGML